MKAKELSARWSKPLAEEAFSLFHEKKMDALRKKFGEENGRVDFRGIPIIQNLGIKDYSAGFTTEMKVTNKIEKFDFSHASLAGGFVASCECIDCKFDELDASEGSTGGIFRECSFDHASFGQLSGIFNFCTLHSARFTGWIARIRAQGSSFRDAKYRRGKVFMCTFIDRDFSGAKFSSSWFKECHFVGCKFSRSTGSGCDFGNQCIFENCPDITKQFLSSWTTHPEDMPEIIGDAE